MYEELVNLLNLSMTSPEEAGYKMQELAYSQLNLQEPTPGLVVTPSRSRRRNHPYAQRTPLRDAHVYQSSVRTPLRDVHAYQPPVSLLYHYYVLLILFRLLHFKALYLPRSFLWRTLLISPSSILDHVSFLITYSCITLSIFRYALDPLKSWICQLDDTHACHL